MLFTTVKIICILMGLITIMTLFWSKIRPLGKILGTIVALLIAFSPNSVNLITESVYVIANLIMLITTVIFKIRLQNKD